MVDPAPPRPDLSRLRIQREGQGTRRYRGFPWFGAIVLLLLAGAGWLYREPLLGLAATVRLPEVEVARAARVVPGRGGDGDVAANGYVVANRQASVATVLSGRLVEIHAEEGDLVPAGAVLGRIQFEDYEAARQAASERAKVAQAQVVQAQRGIEEAQADVPRLEALLEAQRRDVAQARETLQRLEREVQRNRPLSESNVIDEGTWDRIQVDAQAGREALAAAQARARAAEAALAGWSASVRRLEATLVVAQGVALAARQDEEVAAITADKTRIRAPFEGLVIRKDAELGEVIAPTGAGNSRGSVFTIVDPASLEVQVELSEKRIRRVTEGDTATIFLDADPERAIPGHVRKIWPRADRTKGTIELRVTFDERPEGVRPEMAARVVFLGASEPVPEAREPYVRVPAAAVVPRGGRDWVFVVDGDVLRLRPVGLGATEGDQRVVTEGLSGGEAVVVNAAASLKDGDRVRVREVR